MLDDLTEAWQAATYVCVFTGAGISTGSGIPDFRGPEGVWKKQRPVMYDDFMANEAARIEYWNQKLQARPAFLAAEPNAAHEALVRLERAGKLHLVITQNIDGLHVAAGSSQHMVVELHGTNRLVACQTCGERSDPDKSFEVFARVGRPPLCGCGGFLKPATISFGQSLAEETLRRAEAGARHCDLAVAIGTSLQVDPAASFCLLAKGTGAKYAIVNRGETAHDGFCDIRVDGDVTELLPELATRLLD